MSSCTLKEADLMTIRKEAASSLSGSKVSSPLRSRMPMVGLWPILASNPVAKARTVNRLARPSITYRSIGVFAAVRSAWTSLAFSNIARGRAWQRQRGCRLPFSTCSGGQKDWKESIPPQRRSWTGHQACKEFPYHERPHWRSFRVQKPRCISFHSLCFFALPSGAKAHLICSLTYGLKPVPFRKPSGICFPSDCICLGAQVGEETSDLRPNVRASGESFPVGSNQTDDVVTLIHGGDKVLGL